ncbi:MAG: hypothetical protein HWE25_10980 [Alphaproteobacteria bacterium]|nr:hypothetical protein [Alphaproteobacteria bacterium]
MFIVFLKFGPNKANAGTHMDAHKAWIKQGVDDGVFCLVGSLQPNMGGAILAHATSGDALAKRIASDPFVAEGIVVPEIHEVLPHQVDDRLAFLQN